ncbi:MAG: MFS transporter [Chloroflexota bacterium]|nr:MFS transporter [Chloroflexota bacterium]
MSHATQVTPAEGGWSRLQGRQRWTALGGIMLGLLLFSLNQTTVGTALPRIVTDLGGLEFYSWVATSYLLTSTAVVPIVGKLSDTYGHKPFYLSGMVLFMVASVLCGLSQTALQLILFRGLQGVAGGILMTNTFALVGELFPPAERGKWQGLTSSVFGLSSLVGPALGGWLTDGPGWRWVFFVNLPVGIVGTVVLLRGLPHIRPQETKPIDWFGATTIVGSVVPLLLAFSWAGTEYAWSSPQITGLLIVAAVLTALFLFAERRASDPIIPLMLFRSRTFAVSTVTMFLVSGGMFGAIIYIPLFVQAVIGTTATASGVVLTPMMLSLVIASIVSGQIISRSGRYRWAVLGGLSLMLAGMWLLSRMGTATSSGEAVRNMVILGTGIGLTMPTLTLAVQNAFPSGQLGVVTAGVQFFRSIGATIGVALMGTFLTRQLAAGLKRDLPPDLRAAIPAELLAQINPQALASPETQATLQAGFSTLADGLALYDRLMLAMRSSLAGAMQEVFFIATILAAIALGVGALLPEVPLRKRHSDEPAEQVGKQLATHGTGSTALTTERHEPRLVREPRSGQAGGQ